MTILFALCIVALVLVALVAVFGGTGSGVRSLDDMYARRQAQREAVAHTSAEPAPTEATDAGPRQPVTHAA